MRIVAIALVLIVAAPAGVRAATSIDQYTTFLASYDNSVQPDYCVGDWRAGVAGEAELVEGRFGNAVSLTDRQSLPGWIVLCDNRYDMLTGGRFQ